MLFVVLGFILFFLLVSGLWLSKQVAHREGLAVKARAKARTLKQQINDIEEICGSLSMYDANQELLTTIYSHIISLVHNVLSHEQSQENKALLEHFENKKNNIDNTTPAKASTPENDHQINILKRHLTKAVTHIRAFIAQGLLNEYEGSDHITRLKKLKVQSEVDAFLMQGKKCEQKQDKMTAISYYKHAKELLLNADVNFEDQTEQVKGISKRIAQIFSDQEKEEKLKKQKEKEKNSVSHPLTTIKDEDEDEGDKQP